MEFHSALTRLWSNTTTELPSRTGADGMKRSHAAWMLVTVALAGSLAFGQGQAYHPLGIDFSGYWTQFGRQQDAALGTAAGDLVDYGGVPLSEAGRLTALAWSASRLTLPQHQCVG